MNARSVSVWRVGCYAWDSLFESQCYEHSFFGFSKYVLVRTKCIPSTAPVHTGTYLQKFWNCKYKQVCAQLAQCCNGMYLSIVPYHLVLLCSITYLLVMHVTILRISTFWFGTWYIKICTAIRAVQIHMYLVPNQNVEILRIVTCITRRYVLLQSSTRWYGTIDRSVPIQHCAIPSMHRVCTWK